MYGVGDDPNEPCVAAFQATFTGQFKDPKGLKAFLGSLKVIMGLLEATNKTIKAHIWFYFGAELFLGLFFSLSLGITLTLLLP